MARNTGLDCMFCAGPCTCNKKAKPVKPKATKPSPEPEPVAPAEPEPVPPPVPRRPSFASVKRVRPVTTVAAPVLEPEPEPKPVVRATPPRPPARPTVPAPTKVPRKNNFAGVRRVPTNVEEEAVKAAIQVFIDAGFTVERLPS